MRILRLIAIFIIPLFIISCALLRPKITSKVYSSKAFFNKGDRLPKTILKNKSTTRIFAYSAQFLTSYDLVINGIRFTYGINEAGVIEYIDTIDPNFRTIDGFSTQTIYGDLQDKLKIGLQCEPGWAYYLPIDKEWNAAFFIGHQATERPPVDSDKITFFFQRK